MLPPNVDDLEATCNSAFGLLSIGADQFSFPGFGFRDLVGKVAVPRLSNFHQGRTGRCHHRAGHLFQGRYKALLIDADTYLLELSRYLHLNPVRIKKHAHLKGEEKRRILETYSWSSYRGYTRLRDRLPFVTYSTILESKDSGSAPD